MPLRPRPLFGEARPRHFIGGARTPCANVLRRAGLCAGTPVMSAPRRSLRTCEELGVTRSCGLLFRAREASARYCSCLAFAERVEITEPSSDTSATLQSARCTSQEVRGDADRQFRRG